MNDKKQNWRVGLGVSGGIAAYKAIEVLRLLQKAGCEVQVAMTPRHRIYPATDLSRFNQSICFG